MLSVNRLTQEWAQGKNLPHSYQEKVSSTNDWSKSEFLLSEDPFHLYLADHQQQGRGRNNNQWQDMADGTILLSTWTFRMEKNPQPILTPLIGLALFRSLKLILNESEFHIKAPNDIYVFEKKLSGILVEIIDQGKQKACVVGIGLNVLSNPKVDRPTVSLAEQCPDWQTHWTAFCDRFYLELNEAVKKGQSSRISDQDCQELLNALNRQKNIEQRYLKVHNDGSLHAPKGLIHWNEL